MNVSRYFKFCIWISALFLLVGLVVGIVRGGLNWGIDFTGGTLITIDLKESFADSDVEKALSAVGVENVPVLRSGDQATATQAIVRIGEIKTSQEESALRDGLLAELKKTHPNVTIESLDKVGSIAGGDLTRGAILAVMIACALILVYIWVRFELLFGISIVCIIAHDMLVIFAVVAMLRLPLNSSYIAALLTIMGYSINATIVVFDRIRENLKRMPLSKNTRAQIADRSVRETLGRSINTTATTLLTIVMVYVLGVDSIREFSLPIIVGLLSGAYSSVFLSSPLWAILSDWADKRRRAAKVKKMQVRKSIKKARA